MTYNDVRKNENKGFSLVELIVVVAIMAVLVAVLAPSLLAYVERSRAQKDDSAMGEVTNAVMLALADQDVYDEVLCYAAYNNVSCYIDKADEPTDGKTETKPEVTVTQTLTSGAQYIFGDEHRIADEVEYYAAGNMRGVTITFKRDNGNSANKSTFDLSKGDINKFATLAKGGTGTLKVARATSAVYVGGTTPAAATFGGMTADGSTHYLYNRVRATVGDKIELSSQTYRNSEYTVFIRMGTTGGNQAEHQDAIKVYGQWNGTNLKASS